MTSKGSHSTPDPPLAPGLYLVATPIGNLEDITLRALRVLHSADRIACEDTRQTARLLHHFGISTPTVSYHLHNEAGRAEELLQSLQTGARIALVSDAGTPAIADPGAELVTKALAANIPIFPIPGANAALAALIAGGLSTEAFAFHGFLPSKAGQRRTILEQLRTELSAAHIGNSDAPPTTQIFYETPHRILEALADIAAILGPTHRIVLARELTKLHEEFLRGPVAAVLATLQQRPAIRGEIVLLLDGHLSPPTERAPTQTTLAAEITRLMREEKLSEMDAVKRAAKSRGLGKSEAYREWQRTRR
ncbi:MAG TPA: 16S rRNA (cytidine(1402)-2'-O)-methyltransferase [Acidobacteriaceae bacterium]|jgi:16S rRNA (cytidine1402-2'-O)-methyltransferase|nr:16S rRNA (cytidine(1402)-2'-O)-methyltransferase [Acidobacteriaceae bacterium]